MEQKLWKIEKWINIGAMIPLAVVIIMGLFFNTWKHASTLLAVSLFILGILLVIGTQILPALRLWKYINRAKSLIINTVMFMIIYIGAYAFFYYQYVIVKSESSFPIFILIGALAYQRFQSTDKTVNKYISQHMELYPEEAKRLEEEKQRELEEARKEAERIAQLEKEEEEKRAGIPDFDDFFNIDKK